MSDRSPEQEANQIAQRCAEKAVHKLLIRFNSSTAELNQLIKEIILQETGLVNKLQQIADLTKDGVCLMHDRDQLRAELAHWRTMAEYTERCQECGCELSACGEPCLDGTPSMDCPLCRRQAAIRELRAELAEANNENALLRTGPAEAGWWSPETVHAYQQELSTAKAALDEARKDKERLESGLTRIAQCIDAPDVDVGGEWQAGLHCGVEDRLCRDRYDGADYGHTVGAERTREWAVNEACHALKRTAIDAALQKEKQ